MATQTKKQGKRQPREMTPAREQFCQYDALHDNGAAAYAHAFPKSRKWTAQVRAVQASKLKANPKIRLRIDELKQELRTKAEQKFSITGDRVLQELGKIGFSNMLDYMSVNPDGSAFCDLSKLTRDQAAAIQEANFETVLSGNPDALSAAGEDDDGDGKKKVAVVKGRIKLADKRSALVDLGKHFGLFEADNRQKAEAEAAAHIASGQRDNDDLARRLALILTNTARKPKKAAVAG